jgi:hypothetical protein
MSDNQTPDGDLPPCNHVWKFVKDWYGDPSIPHGTCDCSHWECKLCGEETDEEPANWDHDVDEDRDSDDDLPDDYAADMAADRWERGRGL